MKVRLLIATLLVIISIAFSGCASSTADNNTTPANNTAANSTEKSNLNVDNNADTPANANANATTSAVTVGAPAPTFSLEDQDGKKVSLSDFAGKIVVLEWINPDCPFVKRHYDAKTMTTTAEKYKGKDVVWLAVNTTSYMGKDKYKEWIKTHNISYPILDDHEGLVGNMYGAKTTPHMYIVGKDGKLAYQGSIDDDPGGDKGKETINFVDQALAELTAGKSVSQPQTKPYGCSVKYAKK